MHPRAAELIETLGLQPHPEGGYFAQVYRSASTVTPDDDRETRAALTTIYFLLTEGQVSAWHRVLSDEVWHFYEGGPLSLTWTDGDGANAVMQLLGPVGADHTPVAVVPAGCWQTARLPKARLQKACPLGAYALVGCTVAPGFEYEDFELVADGSVIGEALP